MADPRGGVPKRTKAEKLELRAQAYALYAQRKSYRDIGATLGIDKETARTYVIQAIKEATIPEIEESIKKDLLLLDQNLATAQARYESTKSARDYETVDRILVHRAKLLGLFAPEKLSANIVHTTPLDQNISKLLNEMDEADASHTIST